MALIKCPDCAKEISSMAESCPHCGYPINKNFQKELICPCFDYDLNVGERIVSFAKDAFIGLEYRNSGASGDIIPTGNITIARHQYGIKIYFEKSFANLIEIQSIHYKQIDGIELLSEEMIKNKSVLKRSIAGGVVFGPLGAVIGGLSGLDKTIIKKILFIRYWDVKDKTLKTLSFILRFKNGKEFVSTVQRLINVN